MNPQLLHQAFNYAEAGLWAVIGLALIGIFVRRRSPRALVSGLLFLAFGATDLIEVRTGAWWRPWGLLVAKAAIVAGLALCLAAHVRENETRNRENEHG